MSTDLNKQTEQPANRGANACYAPGPWRVDEPAYGAIVDGLDNDLALICRDDNENETRQTARLMAAAPELLKVCEDALIHVERAINEHNNAGMLLEAMKYAIRKAKEGV